MKHLILFEAFESDAISKVNKFLSKKLGKIKSYAFIEQLKSLKDNFELPINQIKDSDIQYFSKNKAVNIKSPSGWKPKSTYRIYAFKFWFSIEEGYLGFTGIGDKEYIEDQVNSQFDEEEINYIKDELNIKKGKLLTVDDYRLLKHGQEVIGYFGSRIDKDILSKAKIFIENDRLYAIQNVSNGGSPESGNWIEWGRYSWSLGDVSSIGYDHKKLHIYTETDDNLYVSDSKSNIFNWNLPIVYDSLIRWDHSTTNIRVIEEADFCLMINFDNIISRGYKKVSAIKKERLSSKDGATALLLDKRIKYLNFRRYMNHIIFKMGITKNANIEDLKNLNKIIKTAICSKYPIYSLYTLDGTYFIRSFIQNILQLIKYRDESDLKKIIEYFTDIKNKSIKLSEKYETSEKSIFNSDNKELIQIFTMIKSINDKFTEYVDKQSIETLEDVKVIYLKLNYIKDLFDDELIGMLKVRPIISEFNNRIDYHLDRLKDRRDLMEIDIKKLEKIEKYINSIIN
jgi:hypothetical protein